MLPPTIFWIWSLVFVVAWLGAGLLAAVWYTRLRVEHREETRKCEECIARQKVHSMYWMCAQHQRFDVDYSVSWLVVGGVGSLAGVAVYVLTRAVARATVQKLSLRAELDRERKEAEAMINDLLGRT